jgi:ATP-dependent exoDNAse (exonuclease V) beta subunit
MKKPLTVFKASAGSGKTFTLAVEYIKLLLVNPRAYEGILAVTFTNKATEEMKMRILSQLYGLSHGLPSSDGYLNVIVSDTGMAPEFVRSQAGKALRLLLHNYHFFRVQTIDTFFQGVLRNLAKELGLSANLRVGLNNSQVVEQAVDDIVDSLADDKKLLGVVVRYMNDRLEDEKSWNVIKNIKAFGGAIFNEIYKRNRTKMEEIFADDNFFDDYQGELQKMKKEALEKYMAVGREAIDNVEAAGLSVDESFKGKSRSIMSYFKKLRDGRFAEDTIANKTVNDCLESVDAWVKEDSAESDVIVPLVVEYLMPLLRETEEERDKDARLYNSVMATLRHLNDVRLLKRIEESAHKLNEASQRFMLSDTQGLLHDVMGEDDSPFIFEKIGSQLEHIMIDEFQDTSTVQWANFKTLLTECMSHGNSNLIVGDVKQSIYRFRSGDWRLLNGIEKQFDDGQIDFQPKTTNWRSERGVIAFNNAFFERAAEIEVEGIAEYSRERADELAKAYADVKQEIPAKRMRGGLVHIELLPESEAETMCERTLEIIHDLMAVKGASQRDIAILVRWTKEITTLAKYIEENDSTLKVVSAEAFRLDASKAVSVIVDAMTLLAHPGDEVARAALMRRSTDEQMDLFEEKREALIAMPLHDMAESLVRLFAVDKMTDEGAYVTKFFDHLHGFTNDMAPVLEDFLEAWEEEIHGKTIQTTECDGIRIMTIHKSKGLEFKHVILPYCDWSPNPSHAETLWLQPKEAPFSRLPMVPVDYRSVSSLMGTIYENDGIEEHIQTVVDNLNLLYVAMTRAGHSLFIIGKRYKLPKSGKSSAAPIRSKVIEDVIRKLPGMIEGVPVHIEGLDDAEQVLEMTYDMSGNEECRMKNEEGLARRPEGESQSFSVFDVTPVPVSVPVCSYEGRVEYRQSNDSLAFADDAVGESDRQRYIRIGMVMHQLFASIRTLNDVEPVLRQMEMEGVLYDDTVSRDELIKTLRSKFAAKQVREWFSDRWKVYNECTLLTPSGECRPDRVIADEKETIVIDFKFGKQHAEHQEQVGGYMRLLSEMGMPDVKGFLWYVNDDKVVPVNSKP